MAMFDGLAGKVAATLVRHRERDSTSYLDNPFGGYIKPANEQATGIAKLRHDIASGKLTIAQLQVARLPDLMKRYGWSSKGSANHAKKQVLAWGLGGRTRLPDNTPRRG